MEHKDRDCKDRRTVVTPDGMYEEVRINNSVRKIKVQPTLSRYIREIMDKNYASQEDVAFVLGKDVRILRNKLYRGTFSLQDLCLIGAMFDYKFSMSDGENEHIFYPEDICDKESVERLSEYQSKKKAEDRKKLEEISEEAILEHIISDPKRLKAYAEKLKNVKK